jgi:hypothetical protein
MELLKKHYEKILLGFVLVGLTVGAASLPLMISAERQADEAKTGELIKTPPRELEKIDLKSAEDSIARANRGLTLDLATSNRVFNSMPWQKLPDGQVRKVIPGNTGPEAVTITKLTPLHTRITLDTVSTSDSGSRYLIGVEKEAAPLPANRRKRQTSAMLNQKTESFVIREVRGDPANPSELILELTDTNERVSLTRDKPFLREDGYMADLRYEPERKTWTAVRTGAGAAGTPPLVIEGESYIVVAINKSEVVLSAKSNNKKTVVAYKSGG